MSDDNSDAAFEADASHGGDGETSIDHRLDSIHHTLSTLGLRIDALVTSTTTYRSALTDRLTEYADTVARLTKAQAADLEQYRQANERTIAELRRAVSGSEDVLERVGARIDSLLDGSPDDESRRVLDEVREALLDVASGEVMGVLWDEFRTARQSLDILVARSDESEAADTEPVPEEPDPLRTDVSELASAVRELLQDAEIVEPSEALAATVDQLRIDLAGLDARMESISQLRDDFAELRAVTETAASQTAAGADLSELRSELAAGLDTLRAGLDDINDRLATPPDEPRPDGTLVAIAADVTALRTELVSRFDALRTEADETDEPAVDAADIEGDLQVLRTGVEGIDGEVRTLRTGIEDIIGRLDEGLVLADELAPPAAATSPELADQFATLRDQISTEFDALRQLVDGIARPPAAETSEAPEYAAVDPDTVDLLREEIRAAGGVSDELVEALRNDLVSLRRRITLRAEGEIFTDDQLELIADAVARRLAE